MMFKLRLPSLARKGDRPPESTPERSSDSAADSGVDSSSDSAARSESSFTLRHYAIFGAVGLLIFLLTLPLFLRLDPILRIAFASIARSGTHIGYLNLKLRRSGPDEIRGLTLRFGDGSQFTADEVVSELSWLGFIPGNLKGPLYLHQSRYQSRNFEIGSRSLQTDFDLKKIHRPLNEWRGRVALYTSSLELPQGTTLPLDLPLPLDDLSIESLTLEMDFDEEGVSMDGSSFESNFFRASLTGRGDWGSGKADFGRLNLNLRLCLTPVDDLEERNNSLFGMFLLAGGRAGEPLCFAIGGTPERMRGEIVRGR